MWPRSSYGRPWVCLYKRAAVEYGAHRAINVQASVLVDRHGCLRAVVASSLSQVPNAQIVLADVELAACFSPRCRAGLVMCLESNGPLTHPSHIGSRTPAFYC